MPERIWRVARYAWGRDYHKAIRRAIKRLIKAVEERLGQTIVWRSFTDAVPLLERAFAERAGGGFIGRNSMLIRPGIGSNFMIAEVLWDISIDQIESIPDVYARGCGTCRRCLEACPGNCLHDVSAIGSADSGPGSIAAVSRLDARSCISYLTIEKRGAFSEWEGKLIGEWLFGCDLCQVCCPFNYRLADRRDFKALPELQASEGCGGLLELSEIFGLHSRQAFEARFAGTALMRTGREGLLRNAAFVAANTGARMALPAIIQASLTDSSEVVRDACLRAQHVLKGADYDS